MLKALVVALLLANLGFYAWTQGWLDSVAGVRARGDREPERLLRQVRPESIKILSPAAASAVLSPPPPKPLACLEAGPFSTAQATAAETALKALQPALPEGSWVDLTTDQPGRWIVYMGKYAGADALAKKEDELKRRNVSYEEVHLAGMEPGLSLGSFADHAAADEALAALSRQGIRTARVVEAAAPHIAHVLRADRADPSLAARFSAVQGEAFGKGFLPCVKLAGT